MGRQEEKSRMQMTKKELSSVAGYTYRRLHDIDMSLPESGKLFVKCEEGKYDLALFVQRWVQYKVDNETLGEQTLDEVKAKHEIVKTRKTEIEVAKLEGRLVDVQEIKKLWGNVAKNVTKNLMRLPSLLAPRLTMQSNVLHIAAVIEQEVRDMLTDIADTPLPEEARGEDWEKAESEEE